METFQLENHFSEYATTSGQSRLPTWPAVFIVAPTTAAFSRPRSMQIAHAAGRENIVAIVASAISATASFGSDTEGVSSIATVAIAYDTAPTPHRPARTPWRLV